MRSCVRVQEHCLEVCVCVTAESRNGIFTQSSDAQFRNGNKDCVSFLVSRRKEEKDSMLFERHRHSGNHRHPGIRLAAGRVADRTVSL